LFLALQWGLKVAEKGCMKWNDNIYRCLHEWKLLVNSLSLQPMNLLEIVHLPPTTTLTNEQPYNIFWQEPFPPAIPNQVISDQNLTGQLNNSQLKLTSTIANDVILLNSLVIPPCSVLAGCDNIAAVSWMHKGSVTTDGPVAPLLHL